MGDRVSRARAGKRQHRLGRGHDTGRGVLLDVRHREVVLGRVRQVERGARIPIGWEIAEGHGALGRAESKRPTVIGRDDKTAVEELALRVGEVIAILLEGRAPVRAAVAGRLAENPPGLDRGRREEHRGIGIGPVDVARVVQGGRLVVRLGLIRPVGTDAQGVAGRPTARIGVLSGDHDPAAGLGVALGGAALEVEDVLTPLAQIEVGVNQVQAEALIVRPVLTAAGGQGGIGLQVVRVRVAVREDLIDVEHHEPAALGNACAVRLVEVLGAAVDAIDVRADVEVQILTNPLGEGRLQVLGPAPRRGGVGGTGITVARLAHRRVGEHAGIHVTRQCLHVVGVLVLTADAEGRLNRAVALQRQGLSRTDPSGAGGAHKVRSVRGKL